jgi:hypothetical protein
LQFCHRCLTLFTQTLYRGDPIYLERELGSGYPIGPDYRLSGGPISRSGVPACRRTRTSSAFRGRDRTDGPKARRTFSAQERLEAFPACHSSNVLILSAIPTS